MEIKYVIMPDKADSKEFIVSVNAPTDYFSIQENNIGTTVSFRTKDLSNEFVLQTLNIIKNYSEDTTVEIFDVASNVKLSVLNKPTTLTVTTSNDIDNLVRIINFSSINE